MTWNAPTWSANRPSTHEKTNPPMIGATAADNELAAKLKLIAAVFASAGINFNIMLNELNRNPDPAIPPIPQFKYKIPKFSGVAQPCI